MLLEDQASMDRADIIARVFHLNKKQLMREIFNDVIESLGSARPASGRSNIKSGDSRIDSDHFLEGEDGFQ